MNLFYENQGNSTYLVYRIQPGDELDTMGVGMITNNRIPGFAAAVFTQMDADKFIKYNVSAKVPVSQLFSGPVSKKRLVGVFRSIVDAMLSAEDYMISTQSILLNAEYIFSDVSSCAAEIICLPIMNLCEEHVSLEQFFKNILFTTQFDQTENCDHVAQLINYLNGNPSLSLEDFKKLLQELSETSVPKAQRSGQAAATQPTANVVNTKPVTTEPAVQKTPVAIDSAHPNQSAQVNKANDAPQLDKQQKGMQIPEAKAPVAGKVQQPAKKEKKSGFLSGLFQSNSGKRKGSETQRPAPQGTAPVCAVPCVGTGGMAIPGHELQIGTDASSVTPKAARAAVTNTCTSCGKPLNSNAAFCGFCGARCGGTASQQQAVQQQAVQQQQSIQQVTTPADNPSQGIPLNFGETTVLGGGIGETTVLGGGMPVSQLDPHLIRTKNNERIPLNKPVFRIGKERSYVDYFISDNTAISRSHANIVNHDGEFFVVDTNSTNHTYVNGVMIPSGQETKLAHGDKVRLANEDFEFRLY